MIKKIEQYLLTKYPIVWNIKLVPIALLVAAVQILLFAIGYVITDTAIDFDSNSSYYLIYAGSILVAILIFIYWMIQYNRNNGLKAHYPQSNVSLFVEWLMILGICFIICFIPNALSLGKQMKWKNTVSQKEYVEATQILARAKSLLPCSEYEFEIRNQRALLVGDADVDRTRFDTKLYTYEQDAVEPNNPIEYIGPSLLYYKDNNNYHNYYWDGWANEVDLVHKWLLAEQRDSIEAAIQACLDLHKQHNLKTNVDVNSWMDIIYHPPLYPLPDPEIIAENIYAIDNYTTQRYTQDGTLHSFYIEAGENYENDGFNRWFLLITLVIGMGLSVLVFSARVTSGRSWIFALLSCGVITFVMSILSGIFSLVVWSDFSQALIPSLWLVLLVVIGIVIGMKVAKRKKKGRSKIYINLGLWLIPAVLPLGYLIYDWVQNLESKILYSNDYATTSKDDIFYNLFSINILFTIVMMFPIVMLIRRWKSLPED